MTRGKQRPLTIKFTQYIRIIIGSLFIIQTYDKSKADTEVKRQEAQLAEIGHKGVEVTVNY